MLKRSVYRPTVHVQAENRIAPNRKSQLLCSSWHKLPIVMLSFLLARVFHTKMYLKYIKYMCIVFQLQN